VKIGKIWKKSKLNGKMIGEIWKKSKLNRDKTVDWRYYQGEDFYFIIKAPQLTIHIRKHFVPNGEWTLHPTKIGVTLSLYEWKENQNYQSTCVALHKTFHCDKDKLTPYLVGIVSVSQNLRSTLFVPFHSVSSAYLPPSRV
jgi:hypothetical protein